MMCILELQLSEMSYILLPILCPLLPAPSCRNPRGHIRQGIHFSFSAMWLWQPKVFREPHHRPALGAPIGSVREETTQGQFLPMPP